MKRDAASVPEIESLVANADVEGVIACIESMSAEQRKAQRQGLLRLHAVIQNSRWTSDRGENAQGIAATDEHTRAVGVALLLCGTARDAAQAWLDDDELVRLGLKYRSPALEGLAQAELEISPYRIGTVLKLIASGLTPRPDSDEYAVGLMALPRAVLGRVSLAELLAADPGLGASLARVFDVEGTADCSLASIEKYNHNPELSWMRIFLDLSRQDVFTRAFLLDKTLCALERDWPQYRSGWFCRFHEALSPQLEELAPLAGRYLGLCHSRIPPTVSLALDAIRKLAATGLIDAGTLLSAMTPVMSSSVKSQVEAGVQLIDRVVQHEPAQRFVAASIACAALAHPAAGVQAKILGRLAAWGIDDHAKAALREYLPGIAAVNRGAFAQLIDGYAYSRPAVPAPKPCAGLLRAERISELDKSRELQPIHDLQELVERIAHVFEHSTDVDEFERTVEALVRMARQIKAAGGQFGPVLKRASRATKPLGAELARLLTFILLGDRRNSSAVRDHAGNASLAHQYLIRRIDGLIDLAAQGHELAPLSSPTHSRGFIDPRRLAERIALHQAVDARSAPFEQICALLRIAPTSDDVALKQVRSLSSCEFTTAFRYALGDDVDPGPERGLFLAAARIRHPDSDDARLMERYGDRSPDGATAARYAWRVESRKSSYGNDFHELVVSITAQASESLPDELLAVRRHPPREAPTRRCYTWNFSGIDEGMVRYMATLLPSSLEAFFAEGARMLGNNLDWFEAQWQNRAYLDALLDPCAALKPMATLVLVLGLAGKDPGQTAIAVDALVAATVDGRLEVPTLGGTLRDLLATPLVKAVRLRKSLEAAARAEPRMQAAVFELLCVAVATRAEQCPKDMASLLELLQELLLSQGAMLPPDTHAAIAAMKLGGKGKAVRESLLAQATKA